MIRIVRIIVKTVIIVDRGDEDVEELRPWFLGCLMVLARLVFTPIAANVSVMRAKPTTHAGNFDKALSYHLAPANEASNPLRNIPGIKTPPIG